jgi:Ni,Fe-hydrogenase III component G
MDQSGTSKPQRGRKAVQTVVRKVVPAVLLHWLSKTVAAWMESLVGNDEAASPAHTMLAAIAYLGKVLFGGN